MLTPGATCLEVIAPPGGRGFTVINISHGAQIHVCLAMPTGAGHLVLVFDTTVLMHVLLN